MNQSREGQQKRSSRVKGAGASIGGVGRLVDREWKRLEFLVDGPWNLARVERRRSSFKGLTWGYQKGRSEIPAKVFFDSLFPVRPFFILWFRLTTCFFEVRPDL